MRTLLGLAFAAVSFTIASAQATLPYNIGFEPPTYDPNWFVTGLATGTIQNQGGWLGGGAWVINTADFRSGAQSVRFTASITGATGSNFNAWRKHVPASSGIFVATAWYKFGPQTDGGTAISLELWGNNGANRLANVGVNNSGETFLRLRSNEFPPSGGQPFKSANVTVTTTNWNRLTVVYDKDLNVMYGYVNDVQLRDSAGALLSYSVTDIVVNTVDEYDLGATVINGPNRRAYGIPSTVIKGTHDGYVDDARYYSFSGTGTLWGQVNLQNTVVTDFTGYPVVIEVLDSSGATVETINSTLNEFGDFSVSTALRGDYSFRIKSSHWLSKVTPVSTITDTGLYNLNVSLLNGDVNEDNEVGPADFTILSGAFGSMVGDPNYVAGADLNGDEEVGPADFTILSSNFGEQGE